MSTENQNQGRLHGKVVMMTGVSKGLGKQNAIELAKAGAKLSISARSEAALLETVALCEAEGAEVLGVVCDVTDVGHLENYVTQTVERFGRIDVLVNNANFEAELTPFLQQDISSLRTAFEVGVMAVWRLMQLCHPHMARTEGTASIINLVSGVYETGMEGYASYVPDKAAIRGLSMVAARELGASGIRVNTLAPVALTDTILHGLAPEYSEFVKQQMSVNPLGRFGDPAADIAPVLIFLASDDSRWITGQNFNADGGAVIQA
ncbi:NAD(P)-dependent dehydrogenase (short-subunit alcohol dehydrogenase family) [Pseudoclavibacter sp. JAI123]|uniref:SDR family NAD(P)-dependent oxidoreductase n=1 Tax=Pseudoclavibacter sp. JAI123 TaxID=2723065 RepID=UPI0015C6EC1C|nr:SDR family oxidoreductase [Pseudoclavibacter sp. JAI123]NYF12270.1 NAD(P)-dependent dehydrogenase (short-subunit alcohol dehydrogenase family) [Pseudoclavibacter sp. JAI123]